MLSKLFHCPFDYELIPASRKIPPSEQRLMIVMHGRGDSLRSFRSIREELQQPRLNYLLLNAPRRYDTGYTWYGFEPRQMPGVRQSRAKLMTLLEELELAGVASHDIFLYGFSQGCLMSCDLLLNSGRRFAGVVGISGFLFFSTAWKRRVSRTMRTTPLLITQGIRDTAIPIEITRKQSEQFAKAGLNLTWREYDKEHEIDMAVENLFIRAWVNKLIR